MAIAALVAGGVALWVTGRIPFLKPPSTTPDPDDAEAPAGDAAAASVHRQTAPLSSAQLGAPLVNGRWVTECGASETMKVVVKLDVKMGHAVKVDVKTDPPDSIVAACVDHAARDLRWDVSPKTDHVTVRY